MEVTVSLVILAFAAAAMLKLITAQTRLSREADVRLVATLAVENVAERIRAVDHDGIAAAVDEFRLDSGNANLRFSVESFNSGVDEGLHLTIDALDTSNPSRVLASQHVWRLSRNNENVQE